MEKQIDVPNHEAVKHVKTWSTRFNICAMVKLDEWHTEALGDACAWIPMLGWVMMPHVASFDAAEYEIAPSK